MKENDDIFILSADKGGKTVAMDKEDYKLKMKNIIGDICTYRRLKKDPTSSLQSKNNRLVEKLYNRQLIDAQEKNRLTNKIATAPRIYGLPKIHKDGMPLRPICSSINAPAYELCKYLLDVLKNLTKSSKYNIKDARDFRTRIIDTEINKDEIMISFDVISLFPSIPINLAITTIDKKWDIIAQYTKIPRELFIELLTFCIKETRYFKYDDKIYEQRKGMPMGSPASPVIADIIMEELLDITIDKMESKPKIMTKYVDDLFAIVKKNDVDSTLLILNSFNKQIQFTMEKEMDNKLPYLDSVIIRQGITLKMDWYQKETASGRLINFNSKHPRRTIINTANNFINRVLQISDKDYHNKNKHKIRNILRMNDFPDKMINNLLKIAANKEGRKEYDKEEKPKKIYKSMTYIPGLSERLKHSDIYDKQQFELAYKAHSTVNQLFSQTKSEVKKEDKSNLVYKIKCNGDKSDICQRVYVGTTKTKLKTRLSSHRSDQKALHKPIEQKTALAAHCTTTGHKPNFDDVEILTQERHYGRRYTLEMLHIIDVSPEKRLNFKRDTDGCAQIYRHTIEKHKRKIRQ